MNEQSGTSSNQPSVSTNNWQIERLISLAFNRTKTRFLSYFLTLVLSFGISILLVIGIFLLIGFIFLIYTLTKSSLLVGLLGTLIGLVIVVASYYFTAWYALAYTTILIQDEKLGVIETFKKVRPMIWGFIWFQALSSLFIWGLLPLGILSLGIILVLWTIWSSFSVFVYIEKREKGLSNIWYSKALAGQKFWAITGRLLLIYVAIYFVTFILFSSGNRFVIFMTTILSIFTTPFIISFTYEMYKNLDAPKEVKTPIVWVILSILGWIVMIAAIVFGSYAFTQTVMQLKNNYLQQYKKYEYINEYNQDLLKQIEQTLPTLSPLPDSI